MSEKVPDKIITVLVTGVGAIIGYGIIESLRLCPYKIRIIGMDIYKDAYGRYISDEFIQSIPANSPGYIEFINGIVRNYNIQLIIPGIEQDLYALHDNLGLLNSEVKIVMNNELCITLSKNKWETYSYFKDKKINLIPTLADVTYEECITKFSVPFLMKPTSGYASKGIHEISSLDEFTFYSHKYDNRVIYQKIIGSIENEFTIAIFGNGEGSFFDHIILKRELSKEGATSKAELVEESEVIMEYISQICSLLKPIGPTNVQVRILDNLPYLLEINPRISSSCSIRSALGYNEPGMCIDYFFNGKAPLARVKKRGKVIRHIEDYIIYE